MLLSLIAQAGSEIAIAMYSFTDRVLADALIRASAREVRISVFMHNMQAGNESSVDEFLASAGIEVYRDTSSYAFHHKFMIVDDSLVVTGSYNWSSNANDDNFENAVVIDCPEVALQFKTQLQHLLETYRFERVAAAS